VWFAACYRHTRAAGDTAPYPGDAALALMQAIFICLWRLAAVNRELALLTLDRCKALGTSVSVAAAEARTVELNSCLDKGVASISKSCCAYMLVDWAAHAVRAILRGNHVTALCCSSVTCTTLLLYSIESSCIHSC